MGDPATEPTLELFKVQWRMPHVVLNEVNKLSMLRALESERHLNEFPFLETVRILPIAEYNETFLGHQDCDSAGKTTIR